jgi:hypothetical protein
MKKALVVIWAGLLIVFAFPEMAAEVSKLPGSVTICSDQSFTVDGVESDPGFQEAAWRNGPLLLATPTFDARVIGSRKPDDGLAGVQKETEAHPPGGTDRILDDAPMSVIPVPAALFLLGFGLIGLSGLGRRLKT